MTCLSAGDLVMRPAEPFDRDSASGWLSRVRPCRLTKTAARAPDHDSGSNACPRGDAARNPCFLRCDWANIRVLLRGAKLMRAYSASGNGPNHERAGSVAAVARSCRTRPARRYCGARASARSAGCVDVEPDKVADNARRRHQSTGGGIHTGRPGRRRRSGRSRALVPWPSRLARRWLATRGPAASTSLQVTF